MDSILPSSYLAIFALGIGVIFVLCHVPDFKHDSKEPPYVSWGVGHILGLLRNKSEYYVQLSRKSRTPIFTVTLPGIKIYIITAPELITAIQKQPKTLAFQPIEAKIALRLCGISLEADRLARQNDGDHQGLSTDAAIGNRAALSPGPAIEKMNLVMIDNIADSLDGIIPSGQTGTRIYLESWVRGVVTLSSTNSVYGPYNPFKSKLVEQAFWDFERNLSSILLGLFPSIIAPKGLAGRAIVAKAFENYFQINGHDKGSAFVQNRWKAITKRGISTKDAALYEVGASTGIVLNASPAVFWILLLVYSDAELLEDIRMEVDKVIETRIDGIGKTVRVLDTTKLKTHCSLLASVFQETLRYRTVGTSVRQVMEDTFVDESWLLKKDSIVLIPSRVLHGQASVWGPNVDDFNPRRFLKKKTEKSQNCKIPNPAAFRAFGGGTTLCPGRHFATTQVLSFVSLFFMRFDMIPVARKWSLPKTTKTNILSFVMEPNEDIEVEISARDGFETGDWVFGVGNSNTILALVEEDL